MTSVPYNDTQLDYSTCEKCTKYSELEQNVCNHPQSDHFGHMLSEDHPACLMTDAVK